MRDNNKNILLAIVVVLLLSCNESASIDKNKAKEKDCVQHIISLDDSLGKVRNRNSKKISLSETILEYAYGINEEDFKNCSPQFTAAFNHHKESWLHMKSITDKYPELRGEMHELFDQIKEGKDSSAFKIRLEAIWNTWADVEKQAGLP